MIGLISVTLSGAFPNERHFVRDGRNFTLDDSDQVESRLAGTGISVVYSPGADMYPPAIAVIVRHSGQWDAVYGAFQRIFGQRPDAKEDA